MKDLNDLLNEEEPEVKAEVKKKKNPFEALHVSQYTYNKAYAYARIACEIANDTMECGGYLVASKDAKNRIATDAYLAKNQDVSSGTFVIRPKQIMKAGRELDEMGYKVLGWWHSHGYLDTFFSAVDEDGQMTVLNSIAGFNYITETDKQYINDLEREVNNDRLVLTDKKNPGRKYEIITPGDPNKIEVAKLRIINETKIGFAYGLVVNNKRKNRKPYAEIATRDFCTQCKDLEDKSRIVPVKIYQSERIWPNYDVLWDEVEERVKMQKRVRFLVPDLEPGKAQSDQYGGGFRITPTGIRFARIPRFLEL